MNIPVPDVQGFAGATGVGLLVLTALYLLVIVFATNLPAIANAWIQQKEWGVFSFVPLVLVAYVVGLVAISAVDTFYSTPAIDLVMKTGASTSEYVQLKQEAAVLSGGVAAFILFAVASFASAYRLRGWIPTLIFTGLLCCLIAYGSYTLSMHKYADATALAKLIASVK